MPAPARQLVGTDGIKTAVGGEHDDLVGGLGVQPEFQLVAVFEFHRFDGGVVHVPFGSADPAFFGINDGHRFFVDHRFDRDDDDAWRLADVGAAAPKLGLRPESLLQLFDFVFDGFPALAFIFEQRLKLFALFAQFSLFFADFHFFEFAQLTQAHI